MESGQTILAGEVASDVEPKQSDRVRSPAPCTSAPPLRQPHQTDPLLVERIFDNILQTIGCMARVIELNPKAFAEMDEESLRFMLLMPLVIYYEGRATGETFNLEGTTNIIIKVGRRNIFIAQCLVWDDPEHFKTKLVQLLGYTSWRDTKTAIIIFNRNKNLSACRVVFKPWIGHFGRLVKSSAGFLFSSGGAASTE